MYLEWSIYYYRYYDSSSVLHQRTTTLALFTLSCPGSLVPQRVSPSVTPSCLYPAGLEMSCRAAEGAFSTEVDCEWRDGTTRVVADESSARLCDPSPTRSKEMWPVGWWSTLVSPPCISMRLR